MLRLDNISAAYNHNEALKSVSLEIGAGEIVALLGANGAGKTTTLSIISGLLKPRSGELLYCGEKINNLPTDKRVRLGISQVPEGRRIFPKLTILENLKMGAFLNRDKKKIGEDLQTVFSIFPVLAQRKEQSGGTLSGGEQQMLAIGRALMNEPKLLLLDEPSLGLAPVMIEKIFEIIKNINKKNISVLLVEQNAFAALHLAHRGYVLETGRIVLEDTSGNLLKSDLVRKAYLGED